MLALLSKSKGASVVMEKLVDEWSVISSSLFFMKCFVEVSSVKSVRVTHSILGGELITKNGTYEYLQDSRTFRRLKTPHPGELLCRKATQRNTEREQLTSYRDFVARDKTDARIGTVKNLSKRIDYSVR
jgi:hypothetical protein